MNRSHVSNEDGARADLGAARSRPAQREGVHALPFHELSPNGVSVFSVVRYQAARAAQ